MITMDADRKFTKDKVDGALGAIRTGSSIRTAAAQYGMPRSTLFDSLKETHPSTVGKPTVLTESEEGQIAAWIEEMAVAGLPVCEEILRISVGQYAKRMNKKDIFPGGIPSRGWVAKFLKRHPAISKRTANQISKKRVLSENEVRSWFAEVESYLASQDLLEVLSVPSRVFNMDESAFEMAPNPKKKRVFAAKTLKNVQAIQGNSNRESYTVMMAGSADGSLVPPLILFPYKERLPREIVKSVPKEWGVGRTEKGWMNSGSFFEYMSNVFYPWLVKKNIAFPVIVFVDGHRSHATYETVQFCKEKQIILTSLPPNATHFIQPLDVSFFKPMKSSWDTVLVKWRFDNGGAMITRPDFAPLLEQAINAMENKDVTLKNGFRKCGLVPWNANAIDYTSLPNPYAVSKEKRHNIPIPAHNREAEPSLPSCIFLREMNRRLPPELLLAFEEQRRNLLWTGDPEAIQLFDLWRRVSDEVEGQPDFLEIDPTLIGLNITTSVLEGDEYIFCDETISPEESGMTMSSNDVSLDPILFDPQVFITEAVESVDTLEPNDLPPAERLDPPCVAVYPKNPSALGKRKHRVVPAVATSESWHLMYQEEEAAKKLSELTKRQKLEERKEKAELKQKEKEIQAMVKLMKQQERKEQKEKLEDEKKATKAARMLMKKSKSEQKEKKKQTKKSKNKENSPNSVNYPEASSG